MKRKAVKYGSMFFVVAALVITFVVNINAQDRDGRREHRGRERDHDRDRKVVVERHHDDYRDVVVRDRHYFYREGYFYDRRPEGYIRIGAPVGARIEIIPHGYRVVRVHRVNYYLFGGVYYRFLPRERVYVVVQAPL